jgi:hypothetical protein
VAIGSAFGPESYPALILAGHGVSLRIHGGALEIQNGLTHYPQSRETYLFFRRDVDLPERIILLDGSGSISFDVLSWLAEKKSALFALIGKAILSVSRARRVIQPILFGCAGSWKPAKILRREMNIAAR